MLSWLHEVFHALNWCPHGLGFPHLVMDAMAWFGGILSGVWLIVKTYRMVFASWLNNLK